MDIVISNNTGKPIYEQITTQVKAMIISGELKAGMRFPPCVRWQNQSMSVSLLSRERMRSCKEMAL